MLLQGQLKSTRVRTMWIPRRDARQRHVRIKDLDNRSTPASCCHSCCELLMCTCRLLSCLLFAVALGLAVGVAMGHVLYHYDVLQDMLQRLTTALHNQASPAPP